MNLENQKFGEWTVQFPLKKGKRIYWHCKCDCGVERDVLQYSLTSGASTSCGHNTKKGKAFSDITNQTFGLLTALEPTDQRDQNAVVWKCKCECGNIVYWPVDRLKQTLNPHCGCANSLIGQKFHKLTVVSRSYEHTRKSRDIIWKCLCDCGNYCYNSTSDLKADKVYSCGCMRSIGEYNIIQCLTKNNIKFQKEFTFPDLRDKNLLRFDFALFRINENIPFRLIEFDGEQHFQKDNGFFSPIQQQHDELKNQYAKEHNIPLVRIPYKYKNNITLDKILGDEYLV